MEHICTFAKWEPIATPSVCLYSLLLKNERGVVLLNGNDYASKMENILSNSTKFVKFKFIDLIAITTKFEDKVIRLVNKLVFLGIIQ